MSYHILNIHIFFLSTILAKKKKLAEKQQAFESLRNYKQIILQLYLK